MVWPLIAAAVAAAASGALQGGEKIKRENKIAGQKRGVGVLNSLSQGRPQRQAQPPMGQMGMSQPAQQQAPPPGYGQQGQVDSNGMMQMIMRMLQQKQAGGGQDYMPTMDQAGGGPGYMPTRR